MLFGIKSLHTYIHTYIYSIGLSYFQKIINLLKVHFTSLKRVSKVYLFVSYFQKIRFDAIIQAKSILGECCL
mgnify:CR=1 FL=1